jgi:hypothetical protein
MGNNKAARIVFNCDFCGCASSEKPSHYVRKKRHFCSMLCYSGFRRDILPKEEQHAYKGGGLPEDEKSLRRTARSKLNHAVRDGIVQKLPCVKCGNVLSEGHHNDHSKPLDVTWLCFKHHRMEHGQLIHENPELLQP